MVLPFIVAGASFLPTVMNIGSKVGKFYNKIPGSSFKQAAQFGLGYGGATAVGYNLVPQFGKSKFNNTKQIYIGNKMPYRRYSNYSRYSRYPYRSSRYSRYRKRRPSYYARRYY